MKKLKLDADKTVHVATHDSKTKVTKHQRYATQQLQVSRVKKKRANAATHERKLRTPVDIGQDKQWRQKLHVPAGRGDYCTMARILHKKKKQ